MSGDRAGAIARFLAQPALARLLQALDGDGEETRVVGGAVRNLLLGEPASDIDLATTALPQETMRRGKAAGFKAVPTGIEHGTITLVADGASFEVTTLRRDVETDGRRAKVVFGRDFAADAVRRDFTINALGLGRDGRVHDDCGGLDDLAQRRVRFIGDAGTRIREDYLRILRFFRFHARYGVGAPDAEGLRACIAGREGIAGLSRERVRAELLKLLVAPGVVSTIGAMVGAGLLVPVIGGVPHLSRFAAIARGRRDGVHPVLLLAALAVAVREDAERLRERLRLSNAEFEQAAGIAAALEALSGWPALPEIAALRRLALRIGADAVRGGLDVLCGERGGAWVSTAIAELGRTPPFLPSGRDLLERGVAAGPMIGRILERAQDRWIEAGSPADAAAQYVILDEVLARFTS
jgi:poly(A) polymerase